MFEQQIPMPDLTDKRFAVADAAPAHGLLTVCAVFGHSGVTDHAA